MKTKHAAVAVLKDGEKVYMGHAGKDDVEYGLVLEALDDGDFGCDLFFRNEAFAEHDAFGYVWNEDSKESCAQFASAQDAVDYALGTLTGMLQQLADAGMLTVRGERGDLVTILA
jgi:hypothetical protein